MRDGSKVRVVGQGDRFNVVFAGREDVFASSDEDISSKESFWIPV